MGVARPRNLIAAAPDGTEASFYRTSAGAEIDLVLRFPGNRLWAIEAKRSSAPKVEKGFHFACEDLRPKKAVRRLSRDGALSPGQQDRGDWPGESCYRNKVGEVGRQATLRHPLKDSIGFLSR